MKKYITLLGLAVAILSFNFNMVKVESAAEFVFTKMIHNFGEIPLNEPATATFSFQNTGDQPIVILSAKASCGCTVADYTQGEIQPGEFGEVSAVYNAKKLGAFSKTVTVMASSQDEAIVLNLKGEVIEQ